MYFEVPTMVIAVNRWEVSFRELVAAVSNFERAMVEFRDEVDRAMAAARVQNERLARFAEHDPGPVTMKPTSGRSYRSFRLARGALPARFGSYQGAF